MKEVKRYTEKNRLKWYNKMNEAKVKWNMKGAKPRNVKKECCVNDDE